MNKKTILKFNSIKSIRPVAWLALTILALGAFGNSVQAQAVWLNEGFTSYNSATPPVLDITSSPNLINAGTFNLYTTVINDGGNVARYNKTSTTTGSQIMFGFSPNTGTLSPRTSGYVSFKIKQNTSLNNVVNNTFDVGIGNSDVAITTASSSARLIGLSFKPTAAGADVIVTRADGLNASTFSTTSYATGSVPFSAAFSTVRIWFNDSDSAPMPYTDPSGGAQTLAVNSFVVYLGTTLITPSASGTALAPSATGASLSFGKIGFSTSSSQTIDFSIDDVFAADSVPSGSIITSATTATAQAGYPFRYIIAPYGVTTPEFSTSTLPEGLSLNTATGVISGTISTTATQGLNNITLTATGTGEPATGTLGLTITPAATTVPSITSAATASGNLTKAFSYQITTATTSPSSTPTSYALTGTLPAGLLFNTATGTITGTPTAAGTTIVTYTATNPIGPSTAQTLTITISAAPTYIWSNAGSVWTTGSSWRDGVAPSNSSTLDTATFGNLGTATSVNVGTGQSIGGITFNLGAYAYTWTGTGITVGSVAGIINNSAAIQTFGNKVIIEGGNPTWTSSVAGGGMVFNGGIDLSSGASPRLLTFAGPGNATVSSVIANGGSAPASGVTVTATGTTILSGNNTYDGLTTMNAATGTLTLSGNNSGAAGGVTLTTGTLNINNANALGSGLVTLTAGTINNTSGAAIVNAGNNAVTWGGNLAYGTASNTSLNSLNLGSGVVTTSTSRALTFAGTGNTLTMGALNITAPTSTGRVITVNGAGNTLNMGGLTLTANPSQAVTVELTGAANIGVTGPILNSSVTTAFANGVKVSATGTTTFSGVNAYSGSTEVAKSANLSIPSGGSLAKCGPIAVAGTGTSAGNAANLNLAGAAGVVQVGLNGFVRGGGSMTSLVVDSTGTVEVPLGSTWTTSGTISFTGTTTKVSVTGAPESGQTYTLMTATADITGSTPTLMPTANVVGWALRVTGRSIYLEEVGVVSLASGQTTTYSVANFITGALPLTKRGEGRLILSASNDYTAGTSLEAGTLQIENATALGSGAVYLKGGILKSTVNLDLAKSTFTTTVVGAGNMAYQDAYGAISNFVKYTGNNTTISGPVTLDVASGTTMTMVTLVGNSDANSLVTKLGAGTVKVLGGSTKVSGAALATNGNGSTVLGGWRIREGTVWFSPSSNNGGGNGPITLAGGSAKFTKLQNSNGTFTGFEVPSDLTVENDGLIQYDPDASTLLGQNTLGFNNLTIGSRILEVATASSPGVGQSLPRVNFKSGTLSGSATFNNPSNLDLALQAISGTGGFTKTGLGTLYLSDQPNQAAAFATLTSSTTPTTVESINVEYAGSGYAAAPAVTLVGGGATTQATATATIDSKGRVTSIAVLTPGVGYTSLPRVVIAAPPTVATANSYTGATTVEAGKLNLNGSYASSVTVNSPATLVLDWLTPAEARCSIDQVSSKSTDYNANAANAVVKDLFLTKSVGGYTPNSTLTLTIEAPRKTDGTTLVPGGVAAIATATVNSQGVISALTIANGGSGYVISPKVTIPAPTEPTVVAKTTGSITFDPGAKLVVNNAPARSSYTLLTADGGISGTPELVGLNGYALIKSSDEKSLILQDQRTDPTFTGNLTAAEINYGQSLASSTLIAGSANVSGAFTWKNPSNLLPAGTSNQTMIFTPTETNLYRTVEVNVSIKVNKASLTPVFSGDLSPTYDGAEKSLSAATSPATIVNLTYDGSATAPTRAGIYTVVATVSDANYEGSATTSLMIGRAAQTITFGSLPAVTNGTAPLNLAATASSGLNVSYASSDTSVATVSGSTVTILKAGSTIITASQAGGDNYNAAPEVTQTLTVNPAGTIYNDWLTANGGIASDAAFLDYVFGAATPGALPASLKPTVAVTSGNLVLTYYVRTGTLGLTVTAQTSADLATGAAGWGTSGVTDVPVGEPTTAANGVRVQQRTASVSASSGKKFLRIQAVQAAP